MIVYACVGGVFTLGVFALIAVAAARDKRRGRIMREIEIEWREMREREKGGTAGLAERKGGEWY